MNKYNYIILKDAEGDNVYAIIEVNNNYKFIIGIIQSVKDRKPGTWSIDDILYALNDNNINYTQWDGVLEYCV